MEVTRGTADSGLINLNERAKKLGVIKKKLYLDRGRSKNPAFLG